MEEMPYELKLKIIGSTCKNIKNINKEYNKISKEINKKAEKIQKTYRRHRIKEILESKIYGREELKYESEELWGRSGELIEKLHSYIKYSKYIQKKIQELL